MENREKKPDPLTGLPDKDSFDEWLKAAVDEAESGAQVSLAFYDIDRFLEVNETNGHDAGDTVLKTIATHIERRLPTKDACVCRLGGDEFAVLMPGTEKEQAFLALELARSEIESAEALAHIKPAATVSIGIATYPDDGGTRQELIRKADDALYRAKITGRNKVALAREEKKVPKTSHYTQGQLERLSALSKKEGVGEAELLREALDDLLKKYTS
jgi:diguanylate cyclase (GGDEF)-like protein